MSTIQTTVSPIDGAIVAQRTLATPDALAASVADARVAQSAWKRVPIEERNAIAERFVDALLARSDTLGAEITAQMGRPIRYTPREIDRMAERARAMIALARATLADIALPPLDGFTRFIRREPLGVVLAIAPWNYPYLTAISVALPAILAGNAVLLKHSPQTPLVGERIAEGFAAAGLPDGVLTAIHASPQDTDHLIATGDLDYVAFTGSVAVGHAVQRAASHRFIGVGLELGGKDAAYVRADADLAHAVENIIDGALFNSGQSCCAIERIYVHESLYERFVAEAAALTRTYILGDPRDPATTLGPLVRTESATFVRGQIADAVAAGARALIDEGLFPRSQPGTPYLAPQLLVDVDHTMSVMRDESFGPVVGIMKVSGDEEAVARINDSPFGLTAAVWTGDEAAAAALGDRLEVGTVFMNRCDYLDPELAWTGVKDSGRGCTLSRLGYEHLTRPKSFHLRTRL
jgi:acyl-CoA reductase-like NAD-dependent aldehyde dehydrogenase